MFLAEKDLRLELKINMNTYSFKVNKIWMITQVNSELSKAVGEK